MLPLPFIFPHFKKEVRNSYPTLNATKNIFIANKQYSEKLTNIDYTYSVLDV